MRYCQDCAHAWPQMGNDLSVLKHGVQATLMVAFGVRLSFKTRRSETSDLVGNGPNTVSGSTVSNTELSEFFSAH